MFEYFTDRSRKVMALANQEAQRFNHECIGTEHILLGLVAVGAGGGANVLDSLGVDPQNVGAEVERLMRPGPKVRAPAKLPQTPRARKVIEFAIKEARALDHHCLGTEHLLLGLIRERRGVAAQVLRALGVDIESARRGVRAVGPRAEDPAVPGPGAAAAAADTVQLPAGFRCPACGYDRAGSESRVCPECGYTATDQDIACDERRRVFLECTTVRAWAPVAALAAVAAVWARVFPLVPLAIALAAGAWLAWPLPRLHRRLVWRAWVMCVGWTQLAWLGALAALRVYEAWSPGRSYIERPSALPLFGCAAGTIVGLLGWRWNWKRLGAVGALPPRPRPDSNLMRAVTWAFAAAVLGMLLAVVAGLLALLDLLFPQWYMSR
jgi:hypothetical protein